MRRMAFPRWRFSLVCLFILSDALYLPAEPTALWLALPIAGIIAAFLFSLLSWILREHDLLRIRGIFGRAIGLVAALLALYFTFITLRRLSAFFAETAFPSLPQIITAVLILIIALLLARGGVIQLSMWALPTLAAVLIPLALSFLLTVSDWQPSVLLSGMSDSTLWNTILYCLYHTFLPLIFLFLLQANSRKSFSSGIVAGSLILALTFARNLMLLGVYTSATLSYPTYYAAGLVTFSDFFQRAEALIAGCLTVCELARTAVFIICAARGLQTAFRGWPVLDRLVQKLPSSTHNVS